jgi:hypothetical protein
MIPGGVPLPVAGAGVRQRGLLLKRLLQLYMLGLFLLVPAHEGWYHFILKPLAPSGGAFLYPEHLLVFALSALFWKELVIAARFWAVELSLLGFYAIAYWGSVWANPFSWAEASRSFPVAILIPTLLALLLTAAVQQFGVEPNRDLLPWLFGSMALVCAVGIVAYLVSFGIPASFHEFIYVFRTYKSLFGVKGGVWYGDLTMGNYNVFAACLLPGLLLWLGWQDGDQPRGWMEWVVRAGWLVLVATNLYICYSRGSFLVLNACVMFLLVLKRRARVGWQRLGVGMAALLLFDVLIVLPPGALDHWTGSLRQSETNSATRRLEQWREVAEAPPELVDPAWVARVVELMRTKSWAAQGETATAQELEDLARGARVVESMRRRSKGTPGERTTGQKLRYYLFGLGPGTYGLLAGLGTNANTHNLFINQFVSSGVFAFIAFAALYFRLLVRGWPRKASFEPGSGIQSAGWVGLVAIGLIGILSQYEFAYLGTIAGGALFWLCALLCSRLGRPAVQDELARESSAAGFGGK